MIIYDQEDADEFIAADPIAKTMVDQELNNVKTILEEMKMALIISIKESNLEQYSIDDWKNMEYKIRNYVNKTKELQSKIEELNEIGRLLEENAR